MDKQSRIYMYAFLSRVYADSIDENFLDDLINNEELLQMIGEESSTWIKNTQRNKVFEALNIDFSTVFLMNAKPFETSVVDSKDEILVGLQNPVMQFYFEHNYDLNLAATHIQTPDHISVELGFMQKLVSKDEFELQKEFLQKHVVNWAIPYFIGVKKMCKTPFYKDLCDFTVEFLSSDYDNLINKLKA